MNALPGVLGPRTLRRTVQVRLGFEPLRLPGGKSIFTVSQHQFMNYPGQRSALVFRCLLPEQEKCQPNRKLRNAEESYGGSASGRDKQLCQGVISEPV